MRPHTLPPTRLTLKTTLHKERHLMENVDVPIVTLAATFHSLFPEFASHRQEIVYSRAHFSQALACLIAAGKLNKSSWLLDPANYVAGRDWPKVVMLEKIAEILARFESLQKVKSLLDAKAGGKLPIAKAINEPLLYATGRTSRPILSVHYATGNLLAAAGRTVLQIVTDPYVRPSYLEYAHRPNVFFALFDQQTKKDFLSKAKTAPNFTTKSLKSLHKRLIVTGPPVDPRIVEARQGKNTKNDSRPLRLSITTGGVGTNKEEIRTLLEKLSPQLKNGSLQLTAYAGTHPDFKTMYEDFARRKSLPIANIKDQKRSFRIISAENIFEANELLIKYVFPWADIIVTKPSGDMAYDAVAAGCGLMLLSPIGAWEERIRDIFVEKECAVVARPDDFAKQLTELEVNGKLKTLIKNALAIDKSYLTGAELIVKSLLKLS